MSHSIAHRLRVAMLPIAAIVVVACGGGAAVTQGTDESTGSEPAATSGEEGGGSSLAPAGARSYYAFDPTGSALVRVDPDNGQVDEVLDLEEQRHDGPGRGCPVVRHGQWCRVARRPRGRFDHCGDRRTRNRHVRPERRQQRRLGPPCGVPGLGTSLVRIDPAANTAGEPITPDEGLTFFDVEAGDEGTWLVGSSPEMAATLYAVDPTTGELTDQKVQMVIDADRERGRRRLVGRHDLPGRRGWRPGHRQVRPRDRRADHDRDPRRSRPRSPSGPAACGRSPAWARTEPRYRIDPATGALTATIPLGEAESGYVEGLDRRGRRVGQHGRWRKLRGRSCRQLDRRRSRLDGDPRPVLPVGTARPAPVGISPAGASRRTRRSHR